MSNYKNNRGLIFAGIIALCGFLFYFVAYTPGLFTPDTIDQYSQALAGSYEDGHPPVMAWLWHMMMILHKGPSMLLAFHLVLFWGALLAIFASQRKQSSRPYVIFILGAVPWVGNLLGMLWKDIGMAVAWLAAYAVLLYAKQIDGHRRFLGVVFSAVFLYGLFVRVNALLGALPLIYFACSTLGRSRGFKAQLILSLTLLVVAVGLNHVFDHYIARAKHTEVTQTHIMFDDLRALSQRAGRNLNPPDTGITDNLMSQCPPTSGVDYCYSAHGWSIGVAKNPSYYPELKKAWLSSAKADPVGWLRFRLNAYAQLLRWSGAPFAIIAVSAEIPPEFGFTYHQSRTSKIIERIVLATASIAPPLFKPYFWLALSIMLSVASLFMRGDNIECVRALLFSGAMYLLGYLLITPYFPFRYAYWTAMSVTCAMLLMASDGRLSWRPAPDGESAL